MKKLSGILLVACLIVSACGKKEEQHSCNLLQIGKEVKCKSMVSNYCGTTFSGCEDGMSYPCQREFSCYQEQD